MNMLPLVVAGMLFIGAAPDLPYGYYQLLRWVVCGASCIGAVKAHEADNELWLWLMIIVAILFNPVIPIRLNRDTWQVVDIVVGAIFMFSRRIFAESSHSAEKLRPVSQSRDHATLLSSGTDNTSATPSRASDSGLDIAKCRDQGMRDPSQWAQQVLKDYTPQHSWQSEPVTEGQKKWLEERGIDGIASKGMALVIMDQYIKNKYK